MSLPDEGRFTKPIERRDFLGLAALGSFLVTTGAAIVGALKLPMPSVLPVAGARFKLGPRDHFLPGSATALAASHRAHPRGVRCADPSRFRNRRRGGR